jgi:DNA-directed RNA polymerase specialized sigma subunit
MLTEKSWNETVDSQADQVEDFDVDAELEEWLRKEAARSDIDPDDPYKGELELIQRWQQDPTPEDFEHLYNTHQPLIYSAGARYIQSTTLPKAAVRSSMLRAYVHALKTYDPTRGAQFKTHLYRGMGRTGRYVNKYTNVGRVIEDRSRLIPLLQESERSLTEMLGRKPSDLELSDDMKISAADYASLRKKKINPRVVGTLRRELRDDLTAEQPGGAAELAGDSEIRRQIVFLHGSLNPEQQVVLEHTFEGFGKPVIDDPINLAKELGLSPQKIRAVRKQIQKKVLKYW